MIEPNVWLDFLSLFGFAYLMFLAGLEVDIALLVRPLGPRWYNPRVALRHPLVAGLLLIGLFLAAAGVGVVLLDRWGKIASDDVLLLLFVFAATAVVVLAPVLKGRDGLGPYAQVLLVAGFLVEFVAIIAIGIIIAIDREGLGLEVLLLLILPAAFLLLLLLAQHGRTQMPSLVRMMTELAHASSQIQIRGALAVLVIFVVLSQVVGTELVLGAFFAGLGLTIISPKHGSSMRVKLDSIGYGFFIPVFFITSGATMDLGALSDSSDAALLIPAFLAIGVLGKLVPALLALWPAFGLRRSAAGGVLFSANLSIILAAVTVTEDSEGLDPATSAALLVLALVSTAAAPLGFGWLMSPVKQRQLGRAVLIGAGRTGADLAPRLYQAGLTVVVIDNDEERLTPLTEIGCETILGDARNREVLELADAELAEVAVIAVEEHNFTYEVALALALEGAVLRPGLFHALEHDGSSGLEEVTVHNPDIAELPLRDRVLPGDVRAILIMRNGSLIVPDGGTALELLDRVALGGDAGAVREAVELLGSRSLADARIDLVGEMHLGEIVAPGSDFPARPRRSRLFRR